MKKSNAAFCLALLLLITGCSRLSQGPGTEPPDSLGYPSTASSPETSFAEPPSSEAPSAKPGDGSSEAALPGGPFVRPSSPASSGLDGDVSLSESGLLRLPYTGNRRYVRYVTSVEQLPGELADEGYDEAFFAHAALVIVVDTVTSGSVRPGISSIAIHDDAAVVSLSYRAPEFGTDDMATWLLWAETDAGLDGLEWTLNAPAFPDTSTNTSRS